ncbi:MAG: YggS family pyridoxal phosphate-dependent enzyme [Sphingobacteriaceae bacterium]|nr:YggS family pyridoxal phosphate-dependent enzyme [Sphingobacteriaceae bacterium]
MSIKSELAALNMELNASAARLVAVSKTHPASAIEQAYAAGQRIFGESTAQELVDKYEKLPKDIEWHFIGHLQSNKAKYIAPFVHLIHAVDSEKLLQTIHKEGLKNNRIINCLLQVHLAREDSKFGLTEPALRAWLETGSWKSYTHARICGLMTIATNTENETILHQEFATLQALFDELKQKYFGEDAHFCELSMGMSADYPLALQHGATLVRVGSRIFGYRDYQKV